MAKNNDGLRPQDIAKDPKVIELLTPEALGGLLLLNIILHSLLIIYFQFIINRLFR